MHRVLCFVFFHRKMPLWLMRKFTRQLNIVFVVLFMRFYLKIAKFLPFFFVHAACNSSAAAAEMTATILFSYVAVIKSFYFFYLNSKLLYKA